MQTGIQRLYIDVLHTVIVSSDIRKCKKAEQMGYTVSTETGVLGNDQDCLCVWQWG